MTNNENGGCFILTRHSNSLMMASISDRPMDMELVVYTYSCDPIEHGDVCAMNHFWSGGSWPGYEHTRLRYYVDDEQVGQPVNVDFPIGMSDTVLAFVLVLLVLVLVLVLVPRFFGFLQCPSCSCQIVNHVMSHTDWV